MTRSPLPTARLRCLRLDRLVAGPTVPPQIALHRDPARRRRRHILLEPAAPTATGSHQSPASVQRSRCPPRRRCPNASRSRLAPVTAGTAGEGDERAARPRLSLGIDVQAPALSARICGEDASRPLAGSAPKRPAVGAARVAVRRRPVRRAQIGGSSLLRRSSPTEEKAPARPSWSMVAPGNGRHRFELSDAVGQVVDHPDRFGHAEPVAVPGRAGTAGTPVPKVRWPARPLLKQRPRSGLFISAKGQHTSNLEVHQDTNLGLVVTYAQADQGRERRDHVAHVADRHRSSSTTKSCRPMTHGTGGWRYGSEEHGQ